MGKLSLVFDLTHFYHQESRGQLRAEYCRGRLRMDPGLIILAKHLADWPLRVLNIPSLDRPKPRTPKGKLRLTMNTSEHHLIRLQKSQPS